MKNNGIPAKAVAWATQPGAVITPDEKAFISLVHHFAALGVGYGWMQQQIEWDMAGEVRRSWRMGTGVLSTPDRALGSAVEGEEIPQPSKAKGGEVSGLEAVGLTFVTFACLVATVGILSLAIVGARHLLKSAKVGTNLAAGLKLNEREIERLSNERQ